MDAGLKSALQGASVTVFSAVRIALNSGPVIRLIDGSGEVSFSVNGSSETFVSTDATYGTLATLGAVEEKVAEEAPRFRFTVFPTEAGGIADWSAVGEQGSPISVFFGTVSPTTGLVIGTPEEVWKGRLDTATTTVDLNTLAIEIDSISAYERLFVAEEAARLNGVWHQSIWAGETGLDYVYATNETVYWGVGAEGGRGNGLGGASGGGLRDIAPRRMSEW